MIRHSFAFIFSFLIFFIAFAQDRPVLLNDSTFFEDEDDGQLFQEVSNLNPQRAALLSAVFPGLGQVYNKQYWKVPIVFSGMLVFAHYINYNNKIYHSLRNATLAVNSGLESPYNNITSVDGLARNRDNFWQNRDFLIILGCGFYLLQIVDAHVSAHLDEFIVNKDLAVNIRPSIQSTPLTSQAVGLSLVINF